MDQLLKELDAGERSDDDPRLYAAHSRHFIRRARPLDPSFFPGREKSPEAIQSLANGAYASFCSEPTHDDLPAFRWVVRRGFVPVTGPLYYWMDSAAIRFLRREGPDLLRARARIQRNVRLNLRDGFSQFGTRFNEVLWGLPEWRDGSVSAVQDPEGVTVDIANLRGRALIRAVLEAVGAPMTRAEIGNVIERSFQFAEETSATEHTEVAVAALADDLDSRVALGQLEPRVTRFWDSLSDEDRTLLAIRGYGEGGALRPFRLVAERIGRLGAESWRLKERAILEALRERFDPAEMPEVVRLLASRLEEEGATSA